MTEDEIAARLAALDRRLNYVHGAVVMVVTLGAMVLTVFVVDNWERATTPGSWAAALTGMAVYVGATVFLHRSWKGRGGGFDS